MAKIHRDAKGGLMFECHCGFMHVVHTAESVALGRPADAPQWTWNGDLDAPTITPSVATTWEQRTNRGDDTYDVKRHMCHFFVRDGKQEFLNDCTHEHAGKTLDMLEWED